MLKSSPQRKHSRNSQLILFFSFSFATGIYQVFWFAAENKKYFQLKFLQKVPHFPSIDDKNTSWEVFLTVKDMHRLAVFLQWETLIPEEVINEKLYYYPIHDSWGANTAMQVKERGQFSSQMWLLINKHGLYQTLKELLSLHHWSLLNNWLRVTITMILLFFPVS